MLNLALVTISKNLVYLELCHHRCTIIEIYTCHVSCILVFEDTKTNFKALKMTFVDR